jgi:hypothetical protein
MINNGLNYGRIYGLFLTFQNALMQNNQKRLQTLSMSYELFFIYNLIQSKSENTRLNIDF